MNASRPPGAGPLLADEDAIARLPFVLEVGSDDLPARFQPLAIAHLEQAAAKLLAEAGLACAGVRAVAAPRRLAVWVADLATRQADRVIEVKGPALTAARDATGAWTPAASGFARKNAVALEDCHEVVEPRGRFLAARRLVTGRAAADVLAQELPRVVLGIPFPKTMRWGEGDLAYARPLQWLLALLGDAVVPMRLGDLVADRTSRGHRTLDEDRVFAVPDAGAYFTTLREHAVLVDPAERRAIIVRGFDAAVAELPGAVWTRDEELLEEVVFLSEHPRPLRGAFEERFFTLPPEVIVTALRAHQRYFAVAGPDGRLWPHFLTVRDGGERALEEVRRGNERVLRARLSDALFYWEFDQRRPPHEQVQRLADVTWVEGFGSLLDKTRRLERLGAALWQAGCGDDGPCPAALPRAALLCKTDLVSEMIRDGKEFTRLAGIMGAHYARRAGEAEEVCVAIERHYLPRGAGDELPGDRVSSVLGLADRLDTLVGCWLAGFAPTGTKDAYGLRRHALAILRILLDLQVRVSLNELLRLALAPLAAAQREATVRGELGEFIQVRLAGELEALGCAPDVVRAVLPARGDDPRDALAWAGALAGFRDQPDFLLLATGFKRCQNILEGRFLAGAELDDCPRRWRRGGEAPDGTPLARLPEPAERALLAMGVAAIQPLAQAERQGRYEEVFRLLSGFGPAIDSFFDQVRVNVAEEGLRSLRHAFLREIHGLFVRYADFSALAPPES